ncbi:glycogen debranching N-terminal domain-containing protein [Nocardia tengchongensis]|uniref:glycogen debranching N-terminal domain-containing protein n=1 Tax=Nocardia tengchongensis TaxID=2055889 RepID=UPI0036CD7030
MSVFNAGPPVLIEGGSGVVTLVEAGTFCLSDQLGDIYPGTAHGLFYRDARILTRWVVRVDGASPEQLSVVVREPFQARFVARKPPPHGVASGGGRLPQRPGGGRGECVI